MAIDDRHFVYRVSKFAQARSSCNYYQQVSAKIFPNLSTQHTMGLIFQVHKLDIAMTGRQSDHRIISRTAARDDHSPQIKLSLAALFRVIAIASLQSYESCV